MGELYKPCSCDSLIHRSCLRQWRTGWINPRNYFSCPNCMYSYNLEQVRPPTTESKERMKSNYRVSVIKVWVTVVLAFAGMVAALAGISYGCDTADKNIPVAVRCLMTSVVGGFPNSNSTAAWREDFKRPDVAVWPYYTVFGLFLTSVLVLISFVCFGSMFEESDRRRTGHCNCVDDCCSGASNGPIYIWTDPTYYGHHHHFHTHNNSSCCDDCGNSCGSHHGGCNGCECSGSGGSNDIRGVIATIILIIVVTIIVSAIVTLALFAMKKCSLLYDRLTAMLASQHSELEGETVVLGIGESWRPNDAV
ncbi:transmembrane protein, putative [Bodo saltans]|uniref:Transmembrane protein, putative n=1 Tax=Bodo saltans TaxID=75058 RepID=A0A0S4JJ21_BODSA|nr:transmembrane protein, putative [Bodo saltans]|eukprot:CUG91469.1 transmembrane protein, putative [Bodo saltans]